MRVVLVGKHVCQAPTPVRLHKAARVTTYGEKLTRASCSGREEQACEPRRSLVPFAGRHRTTEREGEGGRREEEEVNS